MIKAAMLMLATVTPAIAEPNCASLPDLMGGLAANFGEQPRVTALMGGSMLIITVAPTGGWTALEVQPDGTACIVAAGEAFEIMDAQPVGAPA